MVDFKRKLGAKAAAVSVDPLEIYEKSDRAVYKGPLRPAQEDVLKISKIVET